MIVNKPVGNNNYTKKDSQKYRKLIKEYNKALDKRDFKNQKRLAPKLRQAINKGLRHFNYQYELLDKNEIAREIYGKPTPSVGEKVNENE
jgi:predicted HNH restriction endonuclease